MMESMDEEEMRQPLTGEVRACCSCIAYGHNHGGQKLQCCLLLHLAGEVRASCSVHTHVSASNNSSAASSLCSAT
jgi:hypothetical protein